MHWQREWIAALHTPGSLPPGLAAPNDLARFEAYRASFTANHAQALTDTYPVVAQLVGDDCFRQTARAYLHASPPHSGDIHDWGASFADFVRARPMFDALPWLPDVARLEWLAHLAFHAADAAPLALDTLAHLHEADCARLCLLPSLHLFASLWPAVRIWQVNQPDWTGEHTVDANEAGGCYAVWRDGGAIMVQPLADAAWQLAEAITRHGNLGAACGVLDDRADLGEGLFALTTAGLVVAPDKQHCEPETCS